MPVDEAFGVIARIARSGYFCCLLADIGIPGAAYERARREPTRPVHKARRSSGSPTRAEPL
jgi:hypothetical protein